MENKTPQIDRIIALGRDIALLRDELAAKEQELMSFMTGTRPPEPAQHNPAPIGRTMHGSISERVRMFVSANPNRGLPIGEIIAAHRTEDAATIRSTVHRLAHGGLDGFSCVGHGVYRYDHERPFADARVGVQHGKEASS